MDNLDIAIVAPSSVVPPVELDAGLEALRAAGLRLTVYPQCRSRHFTYSGIDRERADAFFDAAANPQFQIIWCARGGYGATRLLPLLKHLTSQRGVPPRKLLVGYSDVTALHAFVHREWGWHTLHAPMPSATYFGPAAPEWEAVLDSVLGRPRTFDWESTPLTFLTPPPSAPIDAPLAGGNLTLLAAMCGTPYFPSLRGTILFLEDVGEAWYRLDRMVTQLFQSGALENVRAIVLGNFQGCKDDVTMGLRERGSREQVALREPINEEQALAEIFGSVGRKLNVPVAKGLPIGHGPDHWPMPLHASCRLAPDGLLTVREWDYWKPSKPEGAHP